MSFCALPCLVGGSFHSVSVFSAVPAKKCTPACTLSQQIVECQPMVQVVHHKLHEEKNRPIIEILEVK